MKEHLKEMREETIEGKTRKEIKDLIQSKQKAIESIYKEIEVLTKESLLLSDDEQWFEEKMETITYRENRKKVSVQKLVGRVYWKERFKDGDTGEVITIERNQAVRVDGVWE